MGGDIETGDLDLPNILVIYSSPLPHDNLKEKYQRAQKEVHNWLALEAAWAEGAVQSKLGSPDLPSDDSLGSKLKRTAYRIEIRQETRIKAPWLSLMTAESDREVFEADKSGVGKAVLHALSAKLGPSFGEVDVLFRPISRGILEGQAFDQRYLFMFVTHKYDNTEEKVLTATDYLSISIEIEDLTDKDQIKVSIKYGETSYRIRHELWAKIEERYKDDIESGENILEKISLHLVEPSSSPL